jgi:lipopolysaccharide transport system ATP-binding protein
MSALPSDVMVRAAGLGKRYRIGATIDRDASLIAVAAKGFAAPARNLRRLRSLRKFGDEETDTANIVWALRDLSFELRQGEILGVVGRNGAGKSTLLKLLARITEPTEGTAELRGRVASLLEVGTGFHPDLTGRENVYLNGTMLGMTRREVASRFDEIMEFAEISKFVDTPVKRYSSGMYVRLAFSVAAHLDPDILVADEVLAVGDAEFQRKCIGEMRSVAEGGRTVIFVSHNHSLVSSLCTRAMWLERGRMRAQGDVDDVLDQYAHSLQHEESIDLAARTDRLGTGRVRVVGVALREPGGSVVRRVTAGEPVELVLTYESDGQPIGAVTASVTAETLLREPILTVSNAFSGDSLEGLPASGELVCRIDELPLNEADYMWTVRLEVDGKTADFIADTARFHVDPSSFFPSGTYPGPKAGSFLVRHTWSAA